MLQIDPSLFQEIVTLDDFNALEPGAKGYIGFEPSGVPHIAQVLVTGERIRALAHAGVHMQILLADWHALINDKLGGDIDRIRESGELMKKSFQAVLQGENVEYLWATDLISREGYLQGLIKTAKATSLPRIRRALPIMGRTEADADSDFSKYIYPIMQANDIFMMDLDTYIIVALLVFNSFISYFQESRASVAVKSHLLGIEFQNLPRSLTIGEHIQYLLPSGNPRL